MAWRAYKEQMTPQKGARPKMSEERRYENSLGTGFGKRRRRPKGGSRHMPDESGPLGRLNARHDCNFFFLTHNRHRGRDDHAKLQVDSSAQKAR